MFLSNELLDIGNLVFPLVISVFIILMIVSTSIAKKVIMKKALVASFLNVFVFIITTIVYNRYIVGNEVFEIIYLSLVGLDLLGFIITGYLCFKNAIHKSNEFELIINGVQKTKFNAYYVIDQKDRILEISDSLVEELGAVKEEVIGKKLFDVFDRTIRIKKFNDTEVNNKGLREFYLDYRHECKPNQQDVREIQFQNFEGTTILLNVLEQPLFVLGKYRGRMVFGEKRAASSIMSTERELIETKNELNSLTAKFIATLDVCEEGLFYYDIEEKYVWGTDVFKKILGLPSNTIGIDDLKSLMYEEDFEAYKIKIAGLTEAKPKYSVTYRTFRNGSYIWVKEHGKRIYDEDCPNMILGFVKPIESGDYEKSNTDLDKIKNDLDLYRDLDQAFKANRLFEIAIVNISTIPEINAKYGRNIGNIMLNEYTRRLKQNFNCDQIYRISGLEFVLVIQDARKMDVLKTTLQSDSTCMDLEMDYGSINEVIKVQIGIAVANEDGDTPEKLVANAKNALAVAKNPNFKKTYCFFHDIR